jgi:lysophospholipase L1-like esterase
MRSIINHSVFLCALLFAFPLWSQDVPRFQTEVNKLIAGDSAVNKKNVILFTGSSSIRIWTSLNADFPTANVLNRGFGGSQMSDLIDYVDKLIVSYHPKQIFIYEGDNDLGAGKSSNEILTDADRLLVSIRKQLPRKVHVFFISAKPSILRWPLRDKYVDFNRKLEAWAKKKKNVTYIDVWTPMLDSDGKVMADLFMEDGLHMNKKGYEIWAKVIGPFIK